MGGEQQHPAPSTQHPAGGMHGGTGEQPRSKRDASDDSGDRPEILPAPILTDVG